jgi:hypothetical protein
MIVRSARDKRRWSRDIDGAANIIITVAVGALANGRAASAIPAGVMAAAGSI